MRQSKVTIWGLWKSRVSLVVLCDSWAVMMGRPNEGRIKEQGCLKSRGAWGAAAPGPGGHLAQAGVLPLPTASLTKWPARPGKRLLETNMLLFTSCSQTHLAYWCPGDAWHRLWGTSWARLRTSGVVWAVFCCFNFVNVYVLFSF